MSRKDEVKMEVKREMVRLLLTTSQLSFSSVSQVKACATQLTDFILEKNQTEEPCDA